MNRTRVRITPTRSFLSSSFRFAALACALASAACVDRDPVEVGSGLPEGLVVVSSDYKSTVVSLLDPITGAVTRDDCINSGSTDPQLSLALSGDVDLPSQPNSDHDVLLIDRQNSALAWIDPATCAPRQQMAVGTGFKANPRDVIVLSATKAYVTRYGANPTPTAEPGDFDEGDDLLIVNPSTQTVVGRIDMAPFAPPVDGAPLPARPDRAVLAAGKVFVTLGATSADFMTTGPGRVAVIDPTKDVVTGVIELPELKSCSAMSWLPAHKTLYVVCGGDFGAAAQQDTAGIAVIDVAAPMPVVTSVLRASAFGGRPFSLGGVAALSPTLGFAVTSGVFGGSPKDQLWSFDAVAGTATKVLDGSDSFTLGRIVADAGLKRAFVADANKDLPVVQVVDASDPVALKIQGVEPNPSSHLPPRQIAWY